MKKKIFIGILAFVLLAMGFLVFQRYMTKRHSPEAVAKYSQNDLEVTIHYCRPYKKGRLIFGEASRNALQPYGQYWRVGANEATIFEVNKDISFGGKVLKAGKYNLYAYPGQDEWDIVIGNNWNRWGAAEPDAHDEVLRIKVPANNKAPFEEQFLISFEEPSTLILHWDTTRLKVPLIAR